ncbi:MAG: hypothetical protein K0Q48_1248 [Bacillota bacterium]|jgi:hypothetical protein|nr:hypothetical protein [Bacillota bacterium]
MSRLNQKKFAKSTRNGLFSAFFHGKITSFKMERLHALRNRQKLTKTNIMFALNRGNMVK